jgi:hypothetical protein
MNKPLSFFNFDSINQGFCQDPWVISIDRGLRISELRICDLNPKTKIAISSIDPIEEILNHKNPFPDPNHRENLGIVIKKLLNEEFVLK